MLTSRLRSSRLRVGYRIRDLVDITFAVIRRSTRDHLHVDRAKYRLVDLLLRRDLQLYRHTYG
jgi:hypothetical protein